MARRARRWFCVHCECWERRPAITCRIALPKATAFAMTRWRKLSARATSWSSASIAGLPPTSLCTARARRAWTSSSPIIICRMQTTARRPRSPSSIRINMDAARAVVELIGSQSKEEARPVAERLDTRNRERKQAEREIFNRAIEDFEGGSEGEAQTHAAVIAGDGWHRGVIGLAASKIAERLNRPCVVISLDGDVGHGSARSIEAYHLFDGLTACRDLLEKFGGHSHAAGLSIRRGQIPEFRRRLNEHAASCLTEQDLVPTLNIDAEVQPRELSFQLSQELGALEPFGAGNPRPVFVTRGFRVMSEPQIIKEQHLKLRVAGEDNRPLEAIWWRGLEENEQVPRANQRIDLAYELEVNRWNNEIRLQLNVRDMQI